MPAFEQDYPFCGNPQCPLHVRAGDPQVRGAGNWARLPDGRWVGRHVYDGILLCDPCGRSARRGPGATATTEVAA
jgi:hypothetical protein